MATAAAALNLPEAYDRCQEFTRRRATSFYYAFAALPKPKRRAIYAAYAFAGTVDDIVDEAATGSASPREQLARAHRLLDAVYDGAPPDTAAGPPWLALALADAVRRYRIPKEYFQDLIRGMEQDLSQTRYATFADLEEYCYRAASVIGLICIEIFGYDRRREARAKAAAVDLGKALQITNIMRDVKEDAARDRVYLAQEDLDRFGYSVAEAKAGAYTDAFRALMREYGRRARAFYAGGSRLLPLLDGARSRMCCSGLGGVYRHLLSEIAAADYDVFTPRSRPSRARRLLLLLRLWAANAPPPALHVWGAGF